jgi:hypothetical protein
MPVSRFLPCLLAFCLMISVAAPLSAQTNFGSVAIGSTTTATVTVKFSTAETLGKISVRSGGAENLDFTAGTGGSCTTGTTYAVGDTCTVTVKFSPKYAGTRPGAVVLEDSTTAGNTLGTAYLQGNGIASQIAFLSTGQSSVVDESVDAFYGAIAADGSGNIYLWGRSSTLNQQALLKDTPSSNGCWLLAPQSIKSRPSPTAPTLRHR